MGKSSGHDRLFCRRPHSGSVHCYSETIDLDQMYELEEHIYNTHTKGNKYDKTHFLLQILGLFASYDPVWMILMIFVVYKIYLAYKISKELPLNCLLGYYMTFISWFHPKIACNISAKRSHAVVHVCTLGAMLLITYPAALFLTFGI